MRRLIPLLFCVTACIGGGQRPSTTSVVPATSTGTSATATETASTTNQQEQLAYAKNPTVNVYLETSGSMNGYVDNGKTQFQQVVFDFLSNIKNSGLPSEMNLNYITDRITPKGNDVNQFINSLTSKGILQAVGNKGTTDIAALVTDILKKTDGSNLSIFISDCIFSPGSVSSPEAYLENQKITIRNAVNDYIANNYFVACTVYQVYSQFKGRYFDYKNRPTNIEMQRPFYIWVFGSPAHIATIKSKVPDANFMGAPVVNTWTIMSGDFSMFDGLNGYGLLQPSPTNGDYRWKSKKEVSNIKKTKDGFLFSFGVDLNLPVLLYGKEYATDVRNYRHIVNKQTNEEFYGTFREDFVKASPYTYDITVISEKPFGRGDFTIVFDGLVPDWVAECNDTDDSVLNAGNSLKTYGFRYMCEGIYAGFHANNTSNITAQYDFVIK